MNDLISSRKHQNRLPSGAARISIDVNDGVESVHILLKPSPEPSDRFPFRFSQLETRLGIEVALCDMACFTSSLIEHVAAIYGGIRRSIEVETDSEVLRVWIGDPMQAKLVIHVCDLVFAI